jgi:hypothetical protein
MSSFPDSVLSVYAVGTFSSRLLILALLFAPAVRAQKDDTDWMDLGVRAGVTWEEKARRDHDPVYAQEANQRHRLYFLAHISEEKNGMNLVKPVNAIAMARELNRQLEAQGFHHVVPGQIPDIVITVKYGRGYLPNPYSGSRDVGGNNMSNSGELAIWPVHDKYVGLEERRQRAGYEKLAIEVRAWKYPPPKDPKQKEELVWVTTITADDPDHRDLDSIYPRMLAMGAPYFDHHLDREKAIDKFIPPPTGQVKVGTPVVVPELKTQ